MLTFLERLRTAWRYAKAAEKKDELEGKVPASTRLAGLALVRGLMNREAICHRCFNRYTPKEREFAERFQLRSILQIPDSVPDPMFCDYCWAVSVESFNRFQTNVGTSNCGHGNLALRRLIAKD